MKKRYFQFCLILISAIMLSACGKNTGENNSEGLHLEEAAQGISGTGQEVSGENKANSSKETVGVQMQEMIVEAGGQKFQAVLYDNVTARALKERLPITINMEELNGNEKYYYLDAELQIQKM